MGLASLLHYQIRRKLDIVKQLSCKNSLHSQSRFYHSSSVVVDLSGATFTETVPHAIRYAWLVCVQCSYFFLFFFSSGGTPRRARRRRRHARSSAAQPRMTARPSTRPVRVRDVLRVMGWVFSCCDCWFANIVPSLLSQRANEIRSVFFFDSFCCVRQGQV